MSCGNPHATPCSEVVDHLDEFIDRELDAASIALLAQHLSECPPCESQVAMALLWKKLVSRSCHSEQAPPQLRQRIIRSITQISTGGVTVSIEETRIIES